MHATSIERVYLAQPMHGRGETLRQGENTRPRPVAIAAARCNKFRSLPRLRRNKIHAERAFGKVQPIAQR